MYHVASLVRSRFSSIAIELTFVNLGRGFKKASSGTRMFLIRLHQSILLHYWVVLRLCIGENLCACPKYSHWYYLLTIGGGAKVSPIAIARWQSNYFCNTDNANFADFFLLLDHDINYFAHDVFSIT